MKATQDLKGICDKQNGKFDMDPNFKGKRLGTLGRSHYMASIFNEQCATTSTLEA